MQKDSALSLLQGEMANKAQKEVEEYYSFFSSKNEEESEKIRKENYKVMVTNFHDLVTDFYEYGWGESFHFAARNVKETFDMSIARSEMYAALRLGLKPGMKVLDVGAGVGGPMRAIARFSGANVVGLNINDYQISRGRIQNERDGLTKLCDFMKGDFMHIPSSDESFDAVYEIEATCHAPDKVGCFKEIFRVLKAGGCFAGYEWCMTDKYDPSNATHKSIKHEIEIGNGLPEIVTTAGCRQALKDAGFEIIELTDFGIPNEVFSIPWYDPLDAKYTLSGFRFTRIGRMLTHYMVTTLETLRIAPKGTIATSAMLNKTADNLVLGGRTGIFTPAYFYVARKPDNKKK